MDASPPNKTPRELMTAGAGNGAAPPAARLYQARYLLAAAAAALLAPSILWGVPFAYTAPAVAVLLLVAAFAPQRRNPRGAPAEADTRAPPGADASLSALLEALPQAAFILDGGGIVRYANGRATELFPATHAGDPFTLTFRWPEIGEALTAAQAGQTRSVEFHAPGEQTRVFSISLSPLKYLPRSRRLILATFDDVSDRLAIARMRSDFVANASHELRTPLASLTGFIETLLGPARDDPQATEQFLKIMLEQARRMRRLVDDLLSLSRAEMRSHRRPTDRVDLVAVLHHVRDSLAPLGGEHGVVLELKTPERPVEVIGDRDELVQVFANLIENGIRYGASGGRVDVLLARPTGESNAVHVDVQDYGPGISPEYLPRLTERFYRVDVGASRELKGTGLGLSIVKHILTRHQGRLAVTSRPGEGARFTVELPCSPLNAANSQAAAAS